MAANEKIAKLFDPIQVGKLRLKNRIAMGPMVVDGGDCEGRKMTVSTEPERYKYKP